MLSLTKKTGYGLIAMCHLARLDGRRPASAREIADRYSVPTALLMNVLKKLAAAGYITSVRGARGGYRLNRRPEQITLADFIRTVEGPIRLAQCFADGDDADVEAHLCERAERCPIVDPLHRLQHKLRDMLDSVTLADIVRPAVAADRAGGSQQGTP